MCLLACETSLPLDVQELKVKSSLSCEAPCPGNEYTISTICAVAAAAVVLLVLVAAITYKLTKQFVQKELLKSLSQSLDNSPISFEVIFFFSFCFTVL